MSTETLGGRKEKKNNDIIVGSRGAYDARITLRHKTSSWLCHRSAARPDSSDLAKPTAVKTGCMTLVRIIVFLFFPDISFLFFFKFLFYFFLILFENFFNTFVVILC